MMRDNFPHGSPPRTKSETVQRLSKGYYTAATAARLSPEHVLAIVTGRGLLKTDEALNLWELWDLQELIVNTNPPPDSNNIHLHRPLDGKVPKVHYQLPCPLEQITYKQALRIVKELGGVSPNSRIVDPNLKAHTIPQLHEQFAKLKIAHDESKKKAYRRRRINLHRED